VSWQVPPTMLERFHHVLGHFELELHIPPDS
jgi:hypothetical protein